MFRSGDRGELLAGKSLGEPRGDRARGGLVIGDEVLSASGTGFEDMPSSPSVIVLIEYLRDLGVPKSSL